jgi:HlyD family secretion protein
MEQATVASRFGTIRARLRAWWAQLNGWKRGLFIVGGIMALVLAMGIAMQVARTRTSATTQTPLQTAVVRRGNLVISATGTGTLTAPQRDLGFAGSGDMTVTAVNVQAGDLVQKGDVLAEVDSSQSRQAYDEAQRACAGLTSISAQAAALRKVADAQAGVQRAQGTLEYLISPEVLYWETQIAQGEEKLKTAKAEAKKAPTDPTAKAAVDKEAAFLDFAQDKLAEAWKTYTKEYVPATFGIKQDLDVDTYNVPSDLEIKKARLAVTAAEKTLKESQELYDALKNGVIPDETTNASLLQVKKAQQQLKEAQASMDGSRITAPFTGTVMEVNIAGGDLVAMDGSGTSSSLSQSSTTTANADPILALVTGSSSSTPASSSSSETLSAEGVIVLADTSQPYLEVYWPESDWPLLKVGNDVQITFDGRQDSVFSGTITEIDRELYTSFESSTIRGEVSLDSPFAELGLPVGASADVVAISERIQDATLVPVEALHETADGTYTVFVYENGQAQLRQVELGPIGEAYAAVRSGLQAGEVVTTGTVKAQ